jgi:hypothetical protein
MNWKQPIPTDILDNGGYNFLDRAVYCEILLRCRNTDTVISFWHGNKYFSENIKRGQMIFRISQAAKEIGIPSERIRKSIEKLKKQQIKIEIKRKPYGLIITVIDYDKITDLQIKTELQEESKRNQNEIKEDTSNKNVKNVKNVNKDGVTDFEIVWQNILPAMRKGKKAAARHYAATVNDADDMERFRLAYHNYTHSKAVADGYVQHGSTWFNNWEDWVTQKPEPQKRISGNPFFDLDGDV